MSEPIVTGLAELQQFLDQLPSKVQRNILRGAVRAGAKVPAAQVKHDAPAEKSGKHPGALRDSVRITTSSRGDVVKASVKVGGAKAFWAIWVERGTKPHEIKPKANRSLFFAGLLRRIVHHPGAKAKPFVEPALKGSNVSRVIDAVGTYIRMRLTKQGIEVPGPENY